LKRTQTGSQVASIPRTERAKVDTECEGVYVSAMYASTDVFAAVRKGNLPGSTREGIYAGSASNTSFLTKKGA